MNRTIDEPDARELELRAASVVKASAALRPESSLSRAIRARLLQRMVTVWARQSRVLPWLAMNIPSIDGRAMDGHHAAARVSRVSSIECMYM